MVMGSEVKRVDDSETETKLVCSDYMIGQDSYEGRYLFINLLNGQKSQGGGTSK